MTHQAPQISQNKLEANFMDQVVFKVDVPYPVNLAPVQRPCVQEMKTAKHHQKLTNVDQRAGDDKMGC